MAHCKISENNKTVSLTKLVRHCRNYSPRDPSFRLISVPTQNLTLSRVVIPVQDALIEIYNAFELHWKEKDALGFWCNEFIFRDDVLDRNENTAESFRYSDHSFLSQGIDQFRSRTHVIFKQTDLGVMWKVLPNSYNTNRVFIKKYDGIFTENYDGISEQIEIGQDNIFRAPLHKRLENKKYIMWMTHFTSH